MPSAGKGSRVPPIKRTLGVLAALAACSVALGAVAGSVQARAIGAFTTKGAWSFWSASKLHPPKLTPTKPVFSRQLATSGYFMAANFYNLNSPTPMIGQSGPFMFDNRLQPVWFSPVPTNVVANNLQVQTYQGRPVLTWWQGVVSNVGATVSGQYVVVDQHYKRVATLNGRGGWVLSLHDFQISGHVAWVTAYKNVPMNLAPYGGPANGTLIDFAVQEYDLSTGQLLGTWDALHHVPLSQSKQPANVSIKGSAIPWDAYHGNSVQLIGSGKFLVSLRNTWGAYLVDINASNVDASTTEWTLSGNQAISNFSLPTRARFSYQHDVRLSPSNVVTLFDDACCALTGAGKFAPASRGSRGLAVKLNMTKHTGSFVAQYQRAKNFDVFFLGSTQVLGGGNVLVGWGSTPYFSEFSKAGKTLLDVRWPGPDVTYRVLRQRWVGTPSSPPSGAVRKPKGKTTVYASWNGATLVAAWRVLAGPSKQRLSVAVSRTGKSGFETAISVPGSHAWFAVQALGSNGRVLGTSKPFASSTPQLVGGY
jgi:Arylsulfotransferase (ASST)